MKTSLCYTYCTLLIVLLVSSGLLFILVASEASKPLNHLQSNEQQKEEHSPLVQYERGHPVELGNGKRNGKAPQETVKSSPEEDVIVQSEKQHKSRQSGSEFEDGVIFKSSDHPKPNSAGSDGEGVKKNGRQKRHGLRKTSARRTSTSRKQDILTEKPVKVEEPPNLKEVIFLDTLSKNSGVTNSGSAAKTFSAVFDVLDDGLEPPLSSKL